MAFRLSKTEEARAKRTPYIDDLAEEVLDERTPCVDDYVQESTPLQVRSDSSFQTPNQAPIWVSEIDLVPKEQPGDVCDMPLKKSKKDKKKKKGKGSAAPPESELEIPSAPEPVFEPSTEPSTETELVSKEGEIKILEERLRWALESRPKLSVTPGTAMADLVERMEALEQQIRQERELRVLREHEWEEGRRLRLEQSLSAWQNRVNILETHKAEYAGILASKQAYYEQKLQLEKQISSRALERQAAENEERMAAQKAEYEDKMTRYESLTAEAEEGMARNEEELARQAADFDAEREGLHSNIQASRAELEERTADNERLQETIQGYQDRVTARFSLLHSSITPRIIMLAQLASKKVSMPDGGMAEKAETFRQSCDLADLTADLLDLPLTDDELTRFIEVNFSNYADPPSLDIQVCACCGRPKFSSASDPPTACIGLDEFYRTGQGIRPLTRCSHAVCSACLLESIENSLASGWFKHLEGYRWFRCPARGCPEFLDIPHVAQLGSVLQRLGSHDVKGLIARHQRVTAFRDALKGLENRPTPASLEIAANLHTRLISQNVMKSFFDPCLEILHPDEDGRLPRLSVGPIRMFSVDNPSGTTDDDRVHSIPIFVKLLRRKTSADGQWCNGCCEPRFEIEYGSVDKWAEVCRQFGGDWMWRILVFPEKLAAACGHDLDHCSDCLANHIKAKLEELGRDVGDNLPCPTEGCNRRLSYNEIKLYADKEVFEKYDRYLLLKPLSKNPNFRWCIQGSCDNGELYEDEDEFIRCGVCNFEMCYRHQSPWHDGFTCDEFDSQREHGDPAFSDTQGWIDQNTKPCPSCGVNITKGEGCFHMTCSSCDYEYCWECGADWHLIWDRESGSYRTEEHEEGCFFRTSNLMPTQITGANLNEALENP